jgi:thermitase
MATTVAHPTFGRCEVVPNLFAIRWNSPVPPEAIDEVLSANSLKPAAGAKAKEAGNGRDPRPVEVNSSQTLTWATGSLPAATRAKVVSQSGAAWVSPVYRAANAEQGPQSYFTVNPNVVLLSQQAAASVGDITALDDSAVVDSARGALLKGLVVINLPKGNALEVAAKAVAAMGNGATSSGVMLENIPYTSPLCCGCGCSTAKPAENGRACGAATTPIFPNDTFFTQQWGLQRINAPNAWAQTQGDPNVVVAVLDQGVELGHPDLNLWPVSYSTITHTNDGSPVGNHGTACAGIIGGKLGNSVGVSGLAGNCRVMAISTNFADTEVAEGLYFAADNGARVVSMSFGVYPSWNVWNFAIIEAALQYCHEKGLVLVAATGNENQNVSRFPATDPRTVGVGGSNRADVRKSIGDTSIESWWGACYGPDVDVVAPCLEIPTTDRLGNSGYTPTDFDLRFNGTSAATPHVAGLAALILSVNPDLSNIDVRRIISETTDKINAGAYVYSSTAGKPFGTWTNEVGYGRINAERALLVACEQPSSGACSSCMPVAQKCCVSPCDPPWRPDSQCMVWYDERFFREPLGRDKQIEIAAAALPGAYIEFRITYEHKLCLLGKQQGPLLYTVTLLPQEKVTLYHSERYRRTTSEQQRFSVRTTFSQYLSLVHQARITGSIDALSSKLSSSGMSSSSAGGGGIITPFGGFGGGSSDSMSSSNSSSSSLHVRLVADQFNQSVVQASYLTTAERSLVVSTFEEKDKTDITSRTIANANDCRAITYFVRQIVELFSLSTFVSDISYRIVAPNFPPTWHPSTDLAWLPHAIQVQIRAILALLPKVGDGVNKAQPITIPTDGAVYDPELANCCSCEPERAAAIRAALEQKETDVMKARLEVQALELEIRRRRLLLERGILSPFEPDPEPDESFAPAPVGGNGELKRPPMTNGSTLAPLAAGR